MLARKLDILLVAAVVSAAGYIIYTRAINPVVPVKHGPKLVKANDILKYKTRLSSEAINTTVTSAACTNFLKTSAEQTLMEYANEFIDHHVAEILKACMGAIPDNLQAKIDEALIRCKDSTREKISNECFGALISAKAGSVATVVKPDVDPHELSSTILLQLISEKFTNGSFFEDPEKSLEFADALIDKEPGFLGGYKVKMMLLSTTSLKETAKYQNEFLDTLDQAKRLSPNDHDLLELEIAERGDVFNPSEEKKKSGPFIEFLEREGAKHPKEWLYDYYKAQALYNNGQGNYDEAVRMVEIALKKAPHDRRLQQTLENLKSDDEQKRSHPFVLSVGFNLNDL